MEYVRLFMRRRYLILGITAAVVAATAVVVLRQPRVYQATTSIIIEPNPPRFLEKTEEVVETGSGVYWSTYYQTQYKVIVSRAVAQRVVDKLGLQSDAAFLGVAAITDPQARAAAMKGIDATAVVQSKIEVGPAKDSRVVMISVQDSSPERAALLANEVAEAYKAESLALRSQMMDSASEWLEEQLAALEAQSKKGELSLFEFRKREDILRTSLEGGQSINDVSQRLNEVNRAYTTVRVKIAGLRAKVNSIRAAQEAAAKGSDARWAEALPDAISNLTIQSAKQRYAQQEGECAQLAGRYLADHPQVVACRERLSAAKTTLLRDLSNLVTATETEYREALSTERNLAELLESVKAEEFELNKKQIEYDQLKREADSSRQQYERVFQRIKDISLTGQLRTSNIRVLDAARPNYRPVKPRVRTSLTLALLFGLLGAFGLVLVLDRLDNTVKTQADVEENLALPFLGLIPKITEAKGAGQDLIVHRSPKSTVAECCRSVRTNLLFMTPDKPLKTLVVTSSAPQEGKSTTIISLGIAMAQSGNRVLLVDSDMRRPRLHKAFGVPNEVGLSTLVIDRQGMDKAIKSTEVPGLFVLPCGPIPPNPSELLHTRAFAELLEQLSGKYDRVLLDSPPVGTLSDAVVLSTQVDGVLFVIKAAKTSRELSRRAIRILGDVNARLFGAILNDVDLENTNYGDYYYAYRTYGAYYGEKRDSPTS